MAGNVNPRYLTYTKAEVQALLEEVNNLRALLSLPALMAYAVCSTGASTATKTVAITGYALPTNGGCLRIKMMHANTATSNVTLNISQTGAKPLYYNGSAVSATNTWEDNEVIEVYYDGTNYQATNAQGGGGSAEPSCVVPTWSGYVGASNATTISNVNLNSLTQYTNASGIMCVTVSSSSYIWFVVNREIKVECNGIEVPLESKGVQNDLYYYKTVEEIASSINVELIALDASQSDDGGGDSGDDDDTPTAETPSVIDPSSATYEMGDSPAALYVDASVSDGGTLSFQWYRDNAAFGSADSGTSQGGGVMRSTCTPTADETHTYYCKVTNNLSGANPKSKNSASVTITFNESSESDSETDLTGFTMGKYINNSGVEENNESYCITPWYTVGGEAGETQLLCFLNGIDNSGGNPKYTWQVEHNGAITSYQRSIGGRRDFYTCTSGDKVRVVMLNNESVLDNCLVSVGGEIKFRGKNMLVFLSKMGNISDYFGKIFKVGGSSPYPVTLDDNTGQIGNTVYSATWVTKAIELVEGHTYRIYTGWLSSTSEFSKYIVVKDEYTSSGVNAASWKTGGSGGITYFTLQVTSENAAIYKYLYCNFALKELKNCYVYDVTDGVYIIKGSNV